MEGNRLANPVHINCDEQHSHHRKDIECPEQPAVNPINKLPRRTRAQAWQIVRQCVGELLGTGLVSFASVRMSEVSSPSILDVVVVSTTLVLADWFAGPISGGHVNPAVTLAFSLSRILSFAYLPIYWVAQFVGAFAGSAIAHAFLDGKPMPLAAVNGGGPTLGSMQMQVFAEYLSSTIFILIVLLSSDSRRPSAWSRCGFNSSLAIGLTSMVNMVMFGPEFPCGFNPAVFLAPSIIRGQYANILIRAFVPFLGSITAALLFQLILCPDAGRRRAFAFFTDQQFEHDRNYYPQTDVQQSCTCGRST